MWTLCNGNADLLSYPLGRGGLREELVYIIAGQTAAQVNIEQVKSVGGKGQAETTAHYWTIVLMFLGGMHFTKDMP